MIFGAEIPFAAYCGIREVGFVDGRTQLRMEVAPDLLNHLGIAHGGALTTLLDVAMGTAARMATGRQVMTLDMQASFLAPGRGVLLAHGHVSKAGRLILFCDAEITREEDGERVARATGVFKVARDAMAD